MALYLTLLLSSLGIVLLVAITVYTCSINEHLKILTGYFMSENPEDGGGRRLEVPITSLADEKKKTETRREVAKTETMERIQRTNIVIFLNRK
ncbi:MAG: hypothetical protein A3F98_03840 [Candidatus Yanofskybacteria bacterium RIFCSPLOWO2_12_FULL_41_8]|uniref:Uncharacterized protein n=1 Tax=Candidatus Yanofskybacteria bacterium RIFCSPHIGHO2_01_FULL_41_53 TaxID=1802663 RepID=A0A1F8EIY1_9BACT|nr:MAG: hypothetical protein A2650_03180 [Candidatus Yanofskybacteria bacterium RIFCSPHIGHO2_01_FULL_41_53]OGN17248.1 MAG: hypothetical protein A3F48_03520 [Candidatus Yanofskybacteria bacterium RIFCSPHIGHO2_12_FULL_41_9]OGN23096.1 MAG: hypothetical protein A2916_05100 [Candidatus Yanofskybacteria bacterium RIFCSPLOWO2_01_FULL_41_67]OGN33708.1 MAG: hypothetical protein A3F98_03840 [Candidatus Yanofskybacteria bacterium RIFCSPLOWO2_12_FULL_41_8]